MIKRSTKPDYKIVIENMYCFVFLGYMLFTLLKGKLTDPGRGIGLKKYF